ncbi:hypothetical protein JST97_24355 [bacterium]|nr:hypothetical protein [bacterium]
MLLAHFILCLVLHFCWPWRGAVAWCLTLALLLTPGYGLAVVLWVGLALRFLPRPSGDLLAEFREHVAPQLEGKRGLALAQLPLVEHLKVQPLIDLLQSPDLQLRKAVLEDMARRRGARLIACIQGALADPNPEIYQFAVAKLGQIQEWHSRQLAEGRLEYSRQPGLESGHWLAQAYLDYLESGLLEVTLQPLYLRQLAELYGDMLARFGRSQALLLARANVWLKLGREGEAAEDFRAVLQLDSQCAEAELGLLQVAYQQRNWSDWRQQARRLKTLGARLPIEVRQRVEWMLR